jgi:hypothetical protein
MTIGNRSAKICQDLPDAINAQCRNGRSHTDFDHVPQYSSEADGYAAANKPKGAEVDTLECTPASQV